MGHDGSKKCKPIPAPPRGAGLKSQPISAPPPLRSGENPHGAKWGGAGQAGRGKIAIPNPLVSYKTEFIKKIKIKRKRVRVLESLFPKSKNTMSINNIYRLRTNKLIPFF